jgi:streptomycin 6-kinase
MVSLPDQFARAMVEVHGAAGAEWLSELPIRIAACARRWSLTVLPPFAPLSYNYVAPAVRADGAPVVLKLGVPNPELTTAIAPPVAEIAALRLCHGQGIVQLLDADPEQGALLLERLTPRRAARVPGTALSRLADDEQATSIAARVMRQIWQPVPPEHSFPTVARWALGLARLRQQFRGATGPFPTRLVEEAEALFAELIGSMAEPVLLHGDLHHDNILTAARQPRLTRRPLWLALDPKGLVGEPAYEVGALLRNPAHEPPDAAPQLLAQPQPGRILARRVDQLAEELGFDRARLRGWGLAQAATGGALAVLSAWWSFEDHGQGWEWSLTCAELLAEMKA